MAGKLSSDSVREVVFSFHIQPIGCWYGSGEVCEQWQVLVILIDSAEHVVVDRFSVPDGKNQHAIFLQLVHHPVIPNTKFPKAFQGLPKRCPVLVGLKSQTRFNSLSNPTAKVTRDVRDIFFADSRVIVGGRTTLSACAVSKRPRSEHGFLQSFDQM